MEDLKFLDIQVGDIVAVFDQYSHDYNVHHIKVQCIEFDREFITEANPEGKHCYGDDLDKDKYGEEYITHITEANFISIDRR